MLETVDLGAHMTTNKAAETRPLVSKVIATANAGAQPDKRALAILFGHYWSPRGWIREHERTLTLADFDYAKSKGLMFDPIDVVHASVIHRLVAAVRQNVQRLIADAFIASLSTRRLEWRSALGSYAVFRHLQDHAPLVEENKCIVCGMYDSRCARDLNVLNFERFKWGGVRHTSPLYAMMDLELFLESEKPLPTSLDVKIFRELITTIEKLPAGISGAALEGKLASIIKSNKGERDVIVAILGFCGVLSTPGNSGFAEKFVADCQRVLPPHRFVDMSYPACWWRSEYGIDRVRLHNYFGHVL